jgi:hypothetical protein
MGGHETLMQVMRVEILLRKDERERQFERCRRKLENTRSWTDFVSPWVVSNIRSCKEGNKPSDCTKDGEFFLCNLGDYCVIM